MSAVDARFAAAKIGTRPWLHAFAVATRAATLSLFTETNTCVATTLIGVNVLARYGIKATPTSVWAEAINGKAYRLREDGVPIAQWPDDAWSVIIRPGARATDIAVDNRTGRGWDGHLVLVLRRGPGQPRTLIDLTADQFHRPHRALHVEGPVFLDIPPGTPWTPQDPMAARTGTAGDPDNPTLVVYHPAPPGDPESTRWRQASDATWLTNADETSVKTIIDAICADIDHLTTPTEPSP